MNKIRAGAISKLLDQIDRGVVSRHDFDCTFNDPSGALISLRFRDNPEFYFKVLHPESDVNKGKDWLSAESPGEFFISEQLYAHRDFTAAYGRLHAWLGRLIEELATSDNSDDTWLSKMRQNLEETADSLPDPDQPFSGDEIDEWKSKFDSMIARLEELEKDNKIRKGQVARLKQQLDQLAEHGANLPKKTWLKTAGHKVLDVFEHGAKSGVEALAKGTVKALIGQ